MNKDLIRQVVNLIAVVAVLIVNSLANIVPFNNLTTGEISDRFDVYFVPAGYVFSIWGLIYLGLIGFGIYQALPSQRGNTRLQGVGYWFLISCLANIGWLFSWHYEQFLLSMLLMLLLLLSLIVIYLRLDIGRTRVSRIETLLVNVPFSLYLGWITVATIANATSLLDYYGWSGWGISDQVWAVIMLATAGFISALMSLTRADIVYSLVIIWAVVGIALKHSTVPLVSIAAWITVVFIFVIMLFGIYRSRHQFDHITD